MKNNKEDKKTKDRSDKFTWKEGDLTYLGKIKPKEIKDDKKTK